MRLRAVVSPRKPTRRRKPGCTRRAGGSLLVLRHLLRGGAQRIALLFGALQRSTGLLLSQRPCRLGLLLCRLVAGLDLLLGRLPQGLLLLLAGLLRLAQGLDIRVQFAVGLVERVGRGLGLGIGRRERRGICRIVVLLDGFRCFGRVVLGLLRGLAGGLQRLAVGRHLLFGSFSRVAQHADLLVQRRLNRLLVLRCGLLGSLGFLLRNLARLLAGLQRRLQQGLRLLLGGLAGGCRSLLGSLLLVGRLLRFGTLVLP